jgi:hypothetical protein
MELNFTELNSSDNNSYQQNGDNYWEKPKVEEKQTRRKKVSFNDILSNMNLVVNNQGVLQFMAPNQNEQPQQYQDSPQQYQDSPQQQQYYQNSPQQQQYYQDSPQQQYYQDSPQQQYYQDSQQNKGSQPILDQSVKHSYIYNKYFKDYGRENSEKVEPRVPKTIQEYHQMLLEDKIKKIQHRKMIEQVKSKKMIFISNPGSTRNIQVSTNNLRMMNFR